MLWVWPPIRLLVPILPLLLWQISVAIRRVPTVAIALIVFFLIATSTLRTIQITEQTRAGGVAWPGLGTAEDWGRMSTLMEWIRRETPSDAVLTGNLDPAYFLYTGRKAVRAFSADPYLLYYPVVDEEMSGPLGSVENLRRRLVLAAVDYYVSTPALGFGETPHLERLREELSRKFPGSFTVVAGDPGAGYGIYRVDRARLTTRQTRAH